MSKRGKKYTADFKTKVILELLEGEQTLNQKTYILGLSNHQYLTRAFNTMPELMQSKKLLNKQSTLGA